MSCILLCVSVTFSEHCAQNNRPTIGASYVLVMCMLLHCYVITPEIISKSP